MWVWDAATGEQRQKLETTTSVKHLEHMEYSTDRTPLRTNVGDFRLDIDNAPHDASPTLPAALQLVGECLFPRIMTGESTHAF